MRQYASTLNTVLEKLPETEKKEYMDLARKWNNSRPPRDVQMR